LGDSPHFRPSRRAYIALMKPTYTWLKRNLGLTAGALCAAGALLVTGCERTDTPQGAADEAADSVRDAARDAADETRDATRDLTTTSRTDDAARDAARETGEAARDAAKDVGRGIEETGEELQRQSK